MAEPQESLEFDDGLEEATDDDVTIVNPFNPAEVEVDVRSPTIDLLMKRLQQGGELQLQPDFQRNIVWSLRAKSRLIESILVRIPLPAFYVDGTDEHRWIVVDGLQRLSAIKEFAVDKTMRLFDLEFLPQYNECRFDDLPRDLRRRFEETQVTVHVIKPGTPENVKFIIFKRINTGGMPLSPQEIRHALNQGPVTSLLKELALNQTFRQATGGIREDRMNDREYVLRFCAFYLEPEPLAVPADFNFDTFLIAAMKRINGMDDAGRMRLRAAFETAMMLATGIFDGFAFRKWAPYDLRKRPLNKALFESWAVALAKLDPINSRLLVARKDAVVRKSRELLQTPEFDRAITQGTSQPSRVEYRFEKVARIIAEVLNDPVTDTP